MLTDPTTGGVTASFAMLGDIILAEPGALVALPVPASLSRRLDRSCQKVFSGQSSWWNMVSFDGIIRREDMKDTLARLLHMHTQKASADTIATADVSDIMHGQKKKKGK